MVPTWWSIIGFSKENVLKMMGFISYMGGLFRTRSWSMWIWTLLDGTHLGPVTCIKEFGSRYSDMLPFIISPAFPMLDRQDSMGRPLRLAPKDSQKHNGTKHRHSKHRMVNQSIDTVCMKYIGIYSNNVEIAYPKKNLAIRSSLDFPILTSVPGSLV